MGADTAVRRRGTWPPLILIGRGLTALVRDGPPLPSVVRRWYSTCACHMNPWENTMELHCVGLSRDGPPLHRPDFLGSNSRCVSENPGCGQERSRAGFWAVERLIGGLGNCASGGTPLGAALQVVLHLAPPVGVSLDPFAVASVAVEG